MKRLFVLSAVALLTAMVLGACSSSNGTGVLVTPTGHSVISMKGGTGSTGGSGDEIYVETYQPKGIKFSKTGSADTGFTVPDYNPPFDAGTNPCTAATTTTVPVLNSGDTEPAANTLYMVSGNDTLYKAADGTSIVPQAGEVCTSLKVNAGVTLTLGLNYDSDGSGAEDMAHLVFNNDVEIDGTLKTADLTTNRNGTSDGTALDMGALDLEAPEVFVTGSINTKGLDAAAGSNNNGGNGGYIYIYAYDYFRNSGAIDNSGGNGDGTGNGGQAGVSMSSGSYLEVYVDGSTDPSSSYAGVFINTGTMTSNGGNGSAGGNPSEIYIYTYSHVYNTGALTANAGTGSTGVGGDGYQDIYIYSYYGSIYNSGAITQKGGDGATGGGNGGYVYMYAGEWDNGDLVNSGNITTTAGSCTGSGDCSGGDAQEVDLYAYGAIRTSGKITMGGGNGHGTGNGGYGGSLYMENYYGYDAGWGAYLPVQDIVVSGDISMNGGNAGASGTGGEGGYLYVYQEESYEAASDASVQFLGYASLDISGGDGTASGGDAGYSYLYTYNDYTYLSDNYQGPIGPIVNEINVNGKGGNGTDASATGGYGAYLYWETDGSYWAPGSAAKLINSGDIEASGGSGGTGGGGESYEIYWYGHDGVQNSGKITMKGGDSVGGTGGDGAYDGIWIYSSTDFENSGTINTSGGSGDTGGNGSWWSGGSPFGDWVEIIAGGQVRNTGNIICNGGDGVTTNGNGGGIELMGQAQGTMKGSLSVASGSGAGAAGLSGQIWVDGVQMK